VQSRLNGVSPSKNGAMMAIPMRPKAAMEGVSPRPSDESRLGEPCADHGVGLELRRQRTQDETDATLRATSTAWGRAMGIDRRVRPDWLIGGFIGGAPAHFRSI
jgi:hypothetical protein